MRTLRLGKLLVCMALIAIYVVINSTCTVSAAEQAKLSPYFNNISGQASDIGCIRLLADGAYACLSQKIVVYKSLHSLYVEEPDRSAGIRVELGNDYTPMQLTTGNIITASGVLSTISGERVFYPDSISYDLSVVAKVSGLGMSSPAIMGWPESPKVPDGPRVTGLIPYGLLIQIWGKPTTDGLADEDGSWYTYLDDGWHKKDGTDANITGIRVYTSNIPSMSGGLVSVIGVLGTKLYDPTPKGIEGDEIIIPCIRTTYSSDLFTPGTSSSAKPTSQISGKVRLIGQTAPGATVRVYSEQGSVTVNNVTDQWSTYTLSSVADNGGPVAASAPGFTSATRLAHGGNTDVDFELQPSSMYIEITSSKQSIAVCSNDTTTIYAKLRDCSGKGISGRQIKLTTSSGDFVLSGTPEIILTSNSTGVVSAELAAATDGATIATIKATAYPSAECSAELSLQLKGPEITLAASPNIINQSGSSVLTATITRNGEVLSDAQITFSTDFGAFAANGNKTYTTVTDSTGVATATLILTAPGTAKVAARYIDICQHTTLNWTAVSYTAYPWYSESILKSNPLVADLNGGDDGKEVVLITSSGDLLALHADGSLMWRRSKFGSGNNSPSCAPMDAERSGKPCIFVPVENQQAVYAFSPEGKTLAGWPTRSKYSFLNVAAAIGDINLDGTSEIVSGDQSCYVFSWNPTGHWMNNADADASCLWINLTGTSNTVIHNSTCALGDIDFDAKSMPDVVVGTVTSPGNLYGFAGDTWGNYSSEGLNLNDWPKPGGGRIESSPAIGDIDGDGKNDVAWGAEDSNIHIWLSSTNSDRLCPTGGPVKSSPALADLDNDGKLDVIAGSDSGYIFAYNWLGQAPAGWIGGIKLNSTANYAIEASPVVGDVTGDGKIDVVVACEDGFVYALYNDGIQHQENGDLTGPVAWVQSCIPPTDTVSQLVTAPVIDDIDNDGLVEVLVAGDKGVYLFNLNVQYTGNSSLYPWPTFHHDNARTGCTTPLHAPVNASIQGLVTRGGQPVQGAKVYIYNADGTSVLKPNTIPEEARSYVLTTATTETNMAGVGAYCISQLAPNRAYQVKIQETSGTITTLDVTVTTGLTRLDVAL
ncbi:MAG: FG-GAP-like repeat-containing protein [Armatimonadota bacterium]|nr:FG-GAP-like repeat-containing protein [bacterium]